MLRRRKTAELWQGAVSPIRARGSGTVFYEEPQKSGSQEKSGSCDERTGVGMLRYHDAPRKRLSRGENMKSHRAGRRRDIVEIFRQCRQNGRTALATIARIPIHLHSQAAPTVW
jgi:hypothetical protein